ncbi:MAG: carbohydrate kinase family protein [Candidatus Limnocylindrales bacterium]
MHDSYGSDVGPQVVCIGSAALDMVLAVNAPPGADERVGASEATLAGGGPAATAAVTLSRLGVSVAFVGRIGTDAAGTFIRDDLDRRGVNTDLLQPDPELTSSMSACLVQPDGSRALAAFSGPATTPWPVTPAIESACRSARWVHVDQAGWQVATQLWARGVHTPLSVDGGNPIPGLDLGIVTLYAPGRRELCRWTAEPDFEKALLVAFHAGAPVVVATDGANGSMALTALPRGTMDLSTARETRPARAGFEPYAIRQSAFPAAGTSTLGAGDVYHGALLAALLDGQPLPLAMAFAAAAAAISCRGIDGRSGIPSRSEVDQLVGVAAVGTSR